MRALLVLVLIGALAASADANEDYRLGRAVVGYDYGPDYAPGFGFHPRLHALSGYRFTGRRSRFRARGYGLGDWRGRYTVYGYGAYGRVSSGRGRGGRYEKPPYWKHPYYLRRFAGMRPYQYYRAARYFGYAPYTRRYGVGARYGLGRGYDRYGGYGSYGGYGYFTYYPRMIAVAPIYSRLGTALSIDGGDFDGPAAGRPADADGLPRPRKSLVGSRFLSDK